jgi:hypothetical protein
MFRWLPLAMAAASLAGAVFFAIAGARPHQLYVETWRGQVEVASTAAASPR